MSEPNSNDVRIQEVKPIGHQSHHSDGENRNTHPQFRTPSETLKDKPKMWMPGDPYQYPLPKPEGDCWGVVLAEKLKGDTIKCDAWKDEVQNLLIFAGLFSAVVTTFIVESYQGLKPDPNDTIVFLLNRIANNDGSAISLPTFTRSASAIRINVLWFLSLIFSLATVLVGIISLQWLREHQRYTDEITQRKFLSIFNMRAQGLDAWYVPQIFTSLPLLLQSALVLFFLGIIDFLFALDVTVAIPVTVGIVLTLIFPVVTSMLPTLQVLSPRNLDEEKCANKTSTPAQCPYRSPQAWIFFRFSSLVYKMLQQFRLTSSRIINENLILFPYRFALSPSEDGQFKSWISFDSWWLSIPEVYMTALDVHRRPYVSPKNNLESLSWVVENHPSQATLPMYIEAESIIEALKKYSSNHTTACALYHCVQEVSAGDSDQDYRRHVNTLFDLYYIQRIPDIQYYGQPFLSFFAPSTLVEPDVNLFSPPDLITQDEQTIWFLGVLWQYGYPQSLRTHFVSHLVELISRSTAHLSTKSRGVLSVKQKKYWDPWVLDNYPTLGPDFGQFIPNEVLEASKTQFYLIFDSFIRQVAEVTKDTPLIPDITYNQPLITESICSTLTRLLGTAICRAESDLPEIFQKTAHSILSNLDRAIRENRERPLLFLTTSYVMVRILGRFAIAKWDLASGRQRVTGMKKWKYDPVHSKPVLSLMDGLTKYHDRFKPVKEYPFAETDLYVWHVTPTFELSRVEIPMAPQQPDPPL